MTNNIILAAQGIVCVLIIVLIVMQQRGTALGSAFGSGGGGAYSTRRGIQKNLLWLTIVLTIVFLALAVVLI
ncbi:MAG: preprotein translocase subunit SecG [Candidatus Paceibacterota bacterium]|jgi:protein translocase SecG subunit